MEVQRFHNPPAGRWRPRKSDGVSQSEFKGLQSRETNDVNPSPRAGENFS
jgi:hypothetical protein